MNGIAGQDQHYGVEVSGWNSDGEFLCRENLARMDAGRIEIRSAENRSSRRHDYFSATSGARPGVQSISDRLPNH